MSDRRDEEPRSATERADELLDRTGQTVGAFASLAGHHVARIASFAREEVEDLWAEAQTVRAGRPKAEPEQSAPSVDASESARRKADELNVDLGEVEGTGADGRVTVSDVKNHIKDTEGDRP
ncbi:MAG: E3 binding domain-containing protein [Rubrobacter sp.]|nr:E3 binding domain-containing protein [Rubrobacter sp.]